MAQNGLITITDSAAASITLTPTFKDGLLASYNNRAASPGLQTELTLSMRKPKANVNDKITMKIEIPYAVTSGDMTSIESATAFVDFVIPERASVLVRKNLVAAVKTSIAHAIVSDLLENNGFPY